MPQSTETPQFPPLLTGHPIGQRDNCFATACQRVACDALDGGDVVWSQDPYRAEIAIVLRPEVKLERAIEMLPLAMVACGDCLGALTPPQVGVTFSWPNILRINGGEAGRVLVGLPSQVALDDVPDWLVVSVSLALHHQDDAGEPGEDPGSTSLGEEGGEDLTHIDVLQSYSAHFMTWLNTWQDDGFKPVHAAWLFRWEDKDLEFIDPAGERTVPGLMRGLDETGNLLVTDNEGRTQMVPLVDYAIRHGDGNGMDSKGAP